MCVYVCMCVRVCVCVCVCGSVYKYILQYYIMLTGEKFMLVWSQNSTIVQIRDKVTWEWSMRNTSTAQTLFSLNLTNPSGHTFTAVVTTNSTSYNYIFSTEGTYYYEVGIIRGGLPTYHQGVVHITGLRPSSADVSVCVGGNRKYCTKQCSSIQDCLTNVNSTSKSPLILYSPYNTPVVDYVEPQQGRLLETVFTIYGTGFSDEANGNCVKFGPLPCDIVNITDRAINCKFLQPSSSPIAWRYYLLSLQVLENNTGNAFIANTRKSAIQIVPEISSVSPLFGSFAGGTDLVITGSIFSFDTEFTLGVPCEFTRVEPNKIICRAKSVEWGKSEEEITRNISICVTKSGKIQCTEDNIFQFSYSKNHTPNVTSVSWSYSSEEANAITISLYGSRFADIREWNIIKVGSTVCNITSSNQSHIVCSVPALPASSYQLSFIVCNSSSNRCLGYAQIHDDYKIINIGVLTKIHPSSGSIHGGTEITLEGSGFHRGTYPFLLNITIGSSPCRVRSVNFTRVKCVTTPPQSVDIGNPQDVRATVDGVSFVADNITFTFLQEATPSVSAVTPSSGQLGDTINITGALLGGAVAGEGEVRVEIGESECEVFISLSTNSSIICSLGVNIVGNHSISVYVPPYGLASVSISTSFEYTLRLYNLSVLQGSFAGGNLLTVHAAGFDPSSTLILICERKCIQASRLATLTQIECVVPRASQLLTEDKSCDVELQSLGRNVSLVSGYNYSVDLTPLIHSINRTRGGTQGGSAIQLEGEGFTSYPRVFIARTRCSVADYNETLIECTTGASSRTVRRRVAVYIDGKGLAWTSVTFWYVDLWSSPFTWKNHTFPSEGDLVVISRGQTLVLDVVTPVLAILVIQGGELVFDEEASDSTVGLHTHRLLIVSQGRLVIGTEHRPFLRKTEVVLYGNRLSTELPLYGTKNIALREGLISVYGHPIPVTWTRLLITVYPGQSTINLRDLVSWVVGGKIVIASTSFSQRENELREIKSISDGSQGSIVVLTEPLEYEHISMQQTIGGRTVDTSAEVGYLTRNIVFRGNRNDEWTQTVTGCSQEFRPGPYQVQTCFQGRFGDEMVGDHFGGHIHIQADTPGMNQVNVKMAFAEITNFGQAFRLGRHPINFHFNGNMSGSYVRGCAIYHTFNRGMSIHSTDYLTVENNIVYDTLGHGYSLDDGTEHHNILQGNLGVFIKPSTTSLNADTSPAVFWVVNADNVLRWNAAAGSSHFGFWYYGSQLGTCLQKLPLRDFEDNSAHSLGLYGLWILRYFPSPTGLCHDNRPTPSHFDGFFSWNNDRGIMCIQCGSVQVRNSIIIDSVTAGVEFTELVSIWGNDGGLLADSVIAGHSQISSDGFCTSYGITVPASYYLTVSNVTFVGFDRVNCVLIGSCATPCKRHQGGFETRYEMINLVNVTRIAKWDWEHQHVHYDMDGTLTGTSAPSSLVPYNNLLDPSECTEHLQSSFGSVKGSICNETIKFGRVLLYNPIPRSLRFTYLNISNDYGSVTLPYVLERSIRYNLFRFMALLQLNVSSNNSHLLTWLEGETFTNLSYSLLTSGTTQSDYILLSQEFPQPIDRVEMQGVVSEPNEFLLDDPSLASTRDYVLDYNNTLLSYVLKGNGITRLRAYNCFYEDCIVPPPPTFTPPTPPERDNNSMLWSRNSSWPDNRVPGDGEDVTISGVYMLLDVPRVRCGRLEIVGATLEVMDGEDRVLEATYIIIRGGRLVAGYPDTPFRAGIRIILHGSNISPELRLGSSPPVGGRSIAVFGELILNAPPRVGRTWSILSTTADKGSLSLSLIHSVDWSEGDEIVITSTSYDAYQSEVARIRSISNNRMLLQLNSSLKYTHMGRASAMGYFGAEVGLLSRRIVIENGDPQLATRQSFGCRVLVTQSFPNQGRAMLRGVEFRGCGQLGYTDDFDPRFALAFLNLQLPGTSSNVTECSFHSGYNTAIGVLNSNNILIEDNVVHGTVGASMRLKGSGLQVTQNLASLAQYIGLFQNVIQKDNPAWTANYDLDTSTSTDVTFQYNSAAGGAMACFHLNGEYMSGDSFSIAMSDNIGHSCLHGVHLGYTDGYSLGSKFQNFTLSFCYYFGFFSYSPASIFISNSVFISNKAAIYVSVIGPPSLRHIVGDSIVRIENTEIISTINQTNRCNDSDPTAAIPPIVAHQNSDGIESPSGGHVGIVIPSFVSGHGSFPHGSWYSVTSYPAINGSTWVTNVTFRNFESYCGDTKKDVLFITNPSSEDANHPVYLRNITEQGGNNGSLKVYIHPPRIGRVNPSDCVDMYCDGMKNVLLKDLDGSYTGHGSLHSIIPLAELNWDGADRRAGIGDYRIPVEMLTDADGSRINVNTLYPKKGIIRGESFGREDDCSFMTDWNAYICSKLDHLMLVVESLDADTEVRRLSPISYGANGFVNLVNGPMDHGFCGGYTCQESISTFYLLLAKGFNYTMALTSNSPQNMALHLLHAADDQAITIAIIYTNPQRLDVHVSENGVDRYVVPNNAYYDGGDLKYRSGEASQFIPKMSDSHGSNFYDRNTKKLYITIRGKRAIKIITTPVVMVSLSFSVGVNEFFDENALIRNIAFLLGISSDSIRLVSITRETGRRRKRQATTDIATAFEIANSSSSQLDTSSTQALSATTSFIRRDTSTSSPTSFSNTDSTSSNTRSVSSTSSPTSFSNTDSTSSNTRSISSTSSPTSFSNTDSTSSNTRSDLSTSSSTSFSTTAQAASSISVQTTESPSPTLSATSLSANTSSVSTNMITTGSITSLQSTTSSSSTGNPSDAIIAYYSVIINQLVNIIQSGLLNYTITSFTITEPVGFVVDPTGGVRATFNTGGPQPGDNVSLITYYQQQIMEEQRKNNLSSPETYKIPCSLEVRHISSRVFEGLPAATGDVTKVAMKACDGSSITRLGFETPWMLSVSIVGKPVGAFIINHEANFTNGVASFDNLIFSHSGPYIFIFSVTYPSAASFISSATNSIAVHERQVSIVIDQQPPQQGNTSFYLYPYPSLHLVDISNGNTLVTDHTWRNLTWYAEAAFVGSSQAPVRIRQSNQAPVRVRLTNGIATFTNLRSHLFGTFAITFSAYYVSEGSDVKLGLVQTASNAIHVVIVSTLRISYTYNISYAVIASNEDAYTDTFRKLFIHRYNYVDVVNVTLYNQGGLVNYVVFVASASTDSLDKIATEITTQANDAQLLFIYNGQVFMPIQVIVDWTPPSEMPQDEKSTSIVAIVVIAILTLPLGFFGGIALVFLVRWLLLKNNRRGTQVDISMVS